MNSILYDFKRNFLRPTVLIITVAFLLLGVGLAYSGYSGVVASHPYLYHNLNVVGLSIPTPKGNEIIGYVFNNSGSPIANAKVIVGTSTYTTNSSGYFVITTNYSKSITVSYHGQEVSFTVAPFFENLTCFISAEGVLRSVPMGFVLARDTLILVTNNPMGQKVSITFVNVTSHNITYVESLNSFINIYKINSPKGIGSLVVSSSGSNVTVGYAYLGFGYNNLLNGLDGSFATVSLAYPLVMVYLAYVMFARPRDIGALKFILARPVTRTGLFLSRYLSGVMIAVISAVLVSSSAYFTYSTLLTASGASLPINVFLYTLAYAIVLLVDMFSIVMMLSTFIKSSATVLGISVFLYIFFMIGLWGLGFPLSGIIPGLIYSAVGNVKEAIEITAELEYFNPAGIGYYTIYYLGRLFYYTSPISTIHLPLVILSALLWIVVPTLIGLMRFRKMNL